MLLVKRGFTLFESFIVIAAIMVIAPLCCSIPGYPASDQDDASQSAQLTLSPVSKKVLKRVVFLGDSITDGNTYPMLLRDALAKRGVKIRAINAGVGGNTAAMMLARLERDVLSENPTLVTLFAGSNDSATRVTPADFEQTMRTIITSVQAKHIPIIVLTPKYVPASQVEKSALLAQYNAVVHKIGPEYGVRLAEVGARMKEASEKGTNVFAPDGHPNYTGQHMIARAVLDAMGYPDLPLPERVKNKLLPGVIRSWEMRPLAPKELRLTETTVSAQVPDASWVTISLPEKDALTGDENLWLDDCRPQGTAIWVKRDVGGETGRYIGVATLKSRSIKKMYFNIGAEMGTIWLNGKKLLEPSAFRGWHLGRESAIGELQRGTNTIVIETGATFFLSVTKQPFWH